MAAYRRLHADAANHLKDDVADSAMILALAAGRCTHPQVVRRMRSYGLFQGVRTHARERIVGTFLAFSHALHSTMPLGAPPPIRAGADIDAASGQYWRYPTKVNTLHQATAALRCELAKRHGVPGRHAIRITVKVSGTNQPLTQLLKL